MTLRLWSRGTASGIRELTLGQVTRVPIEDRAQRRDYVALVDLSGLAAFHGDWREYAGVLSTIPAEEIRDDVPTRAVFAPPNLGYLRDGDVVSLDADGTVRVLFRKHSPHNTILTTERCNSFCLMCSQPPREIDDSYRVSMILRLLDLVDVGARELVISGGEPTLLGDAFFAIINKARLVVPRTALHVLTNGRRFKDAAFASRLAEIRHPDIMLGIPLYSAVGFQHDYIVQAAGAYDETMEGFYNLASVGVKLELRVVLHKQTIPGLVELAEFIARNLPFIEHVALMGLEMFGFTPRNLDVLWIDPVDYGGELAEAVEVLALHGMNVSIYNHQLCTIPRSLWPFTRRSISDWKNLYLDECRNCAAREYCGGLFQSATKRHSAGIHAISTLSTEAKWTMDRIF